jgi:hypothetical protein
VTALQHDTQHATHLQLRLVREIRDRQIAEAREHRLGVAGRPAVGRPSIRRRFGRSVIRLGEAIAAEPEPTLRPASPR